MIHDLRTFALAVSVPFAVAAPSAAQNTIADIVVAASGGATAGQFDRDGNDYDILLNALQTANLVGAVADPNASLTVWAPNDRAFERLARDLGFNGRGEENVWNFLVAALTRLGNGDPIPVLTNVLLYHVTPGELSLFGVILKSIFRRDIDTLLSGATIRPFFIFLGDNDPDAADPRVIKPVNLRASNGIIHGINCVLRPIDLP